LNGIYGVPEWGVKLYKNMPEPIKFTRDEEISILNNLIQKMEKANLFPAISADKLVLLKNNKYHPPFTTAKFLLLEYDLKKEAGEKELKMFLNEFEQELDEFVINKDEFESMLYINENKSIQNKDIVDNDSGIIRYENTLPVYNSKKTVEKFTNYNKDEYIGKKEIIKRKTSSMIYNNNSMFE